MWRLLNYLELEYRPLDSAPDTRLSPEMSQVEIEMRLWRRIDRFKAQRNTFIIHLIAYSVLNGLYWVAYSAWGWGDQDNISFNRFTLLGIIVATLWGLYVTVRGYFLYQNTSAQVARRESTVINTMVPKQAPVASLGEKLKNDQHIAPIHLSNDGELILNDDHSADKMFSATLYTAHPSDVRLDN